MADTSPPVFDYQSSQLVVTPSGIDSENKTTLTADREAEPGTTSDDKFEDFGTVDEAPDGGYGWVIVTACSIVTFFWIGLPYSWGVLQAQFAKDHLTADSTLSIIGAIAVAGVALGAIINTHIIRYMGTRNGALLASLLLGLSWILSGWTTRSVPGLFITYSLMGAMGIGMFYMACGTLPAQYFKSRRGLAGGIIYASGGIGGAVLSISINALVSRVGMPWTFRIMGFITLAVTLPASMLLKERIPRAAVTIDWSLFCDAKFVVLFIGSAIATFPLLVPTFFIPLYANTFGISGSIASILLAVFNISSALGRIGFGALCDRLGPVSSLFLALLVNSLTLLVIWPFSNTLAPLVVFIVISGMGNGGFFSTMPSVVSHMYGPSRVAAALSMVVTGWVVGYIMGAPIAGWILEAYGGAGAGRAAFRPVMYYAGSVSLWSSGFILVVRHLMAR